MIQQPELGKKIADLRKAKGYTQEDLVEKCNLSVRTLQRIESGEVSPRAYTLKLITEALELDYENSFKSITMSNKESFIKGRKQFYNYILDLFNLKTNTMKKVVILFVPCVLIVLFFLFTGTPVKAQDKKVLNSQITVLSARLAAWYNDGQMDSIGTLFLENACMMPVNEKEIHGRNEIIASYKSLYKFGFRFTLSIPKFITVSDSIAIERGNWTGYTTIALSGTYLTQWRLYNGKWYIENEMTNTDFDIVTNK